MISSNDPRGGQHPDNALEFAKLIVQSARRDADDELRDLICMQLRQEIEADAEERSHRLALQRRTQRCNEAVLAFVGLSLAATAFLQAARVSPQVVMGLIVLAGLIVRGGRSHQFIARQFPRRRMR